MQTDQAEGLRRLLERSRLRVVSVNADGGHGAAALVNLAAALAERGSDVLILDAQPAGQGVIAELGLKARYDLEDVIRRERDLDDVIVRGPAGILILPLARGARALTQLPASAQKQLVERCARLGIPLDTLLMNATLAGAGALPWALAATQEVIVIAGGGAAAITSGYASIKRLHHGRGCRDFHVLVSNVASETEARTIFDNMAAVARRYLQVALHFIGHVPADDKLQHAARLCLPVVAAFPRTVAAAGYRSVAQAIAAWPRAEEEDCGFGEFMRRLIHSNDTRAAAA